jgi:hypothetical protein
MPEDAIGPPFDFHELRWLRDQLESKSAHGAGGRLLDIDQLLAFLQDLPDEDDDA